MLPPLPNELEEAAKECRLVPFIGAGFSKNVNDRFPTWDGVIDRMADKLGYDADILKAEATYLQIAEHFDREFPRDMEPLLRRLGQEIDDPVKFPVTVSRPHLLLPLLKVSTIFTTNWDNWIERGFQAVHIGYTKIAVLDHFQKAYGWIPPIPGKKAPDEGYLAFGTTRPSTSIVKLHGDFDFSKGIVVREKDYFDRLDFDHPLDVRFRSEIIGKSVLFIGYSFRDINIRYMWHRLRRSFDGSQQTTKSFFVTHQKSEVLENIDRASNIEHVFIDPRNVKAGITEVLEKIIAHQ